jgi:hypothetical protein
MTALAAGRNTPLRDAEIVGVFIAANAKIFAGALVCASATGFAVPGSTATTLTYLGRAEETVDNTGGADGAKVVLVRRKKMFKWANLAADLVTQADMGKTVYVVDDQTVAKTSGGTTRSLAGRVLGIEADGVWIE